MRRYVLFVFCLFLLAGCGRHYAIDRADMYLSPSVSEMPESFTLVAEILDPVRDIAEGGSGRFAWKSVIIDKNGKESNYLAISIGKRDRAGNKVLLTMIPETLDELNGGYYFSLNHTGTKIYNHLGESRKLKSLGKRIKVKNYKGFLTEIKKGESFIVEVKKDSQAYKSLEKVYLDFRSKELSLARDYVYRKYGSSLTEDEIDEIARDDSIVHSFADWLGRDWKVFLMYPFTSITGTAIVSGVAKVFTIPSIWGDKINKPGYMEYITDAESTAEMALRAIKEYGHLYQQTE